MYQTQHLDQDLHSLDKSRLFTALICQDVQMQIKQYTSDYVASQCPHNWHNISQMVLSLKNAQITRLVRLHTDDQGM